MRASAQDLIPTSGHMEATPTCQGCEKCAPSRAVAVDRKTDRIMRTPPRETGRGGGMQLSPEQRQWYFAALRNARRGRRKGWAE